MNDGESWIRKIIRSSSFRETERLVKQMMQGTESQENEELLSAWIREKGPDIPEMVLDVA